MSAYKTAPWEPLVSRLTVVSSILLLGGGAIMLGAAAAAYTWSPLVAVGLAAGALPLPAIVLVTALLGPTGYRVDEQGVLIRRRGPGLLIPAAQIAGVEEPSDDAFADAIRLTASGGVFGFWGMWQSRQWGRFQAYATRRQGVVVIRRRQGGPLLVTPDRPADFVREARRLYGPVSAAG